MNLSNNARPEGLKMPQDDLAHSGVTLAAPKLATGFRGGTPRPLNELVNRQSDPFHETN